MTYDPYVELERAGNANGNGIPSQVLLWVREGCKCDGCSRRSCCGDKEAPGKQSNHDDLLLPRQLESTNIWNRNQYDEEVGCRVDAPGRE